MAKPVCGWHKETLQLRKNNEKSYEQMADIMVMLEELTPTAVKAMPHTCNYALFCLAMHHFAMRFHVGAKKQTVKHMLNSSVNELPKSFGDFGKIKINGQ